MKNSFAPLISILRPKRCVLFAESTLLTTDDRVSGSNARPSHGTGRIEVCQKSFQTDQDPLLCSSPGGPWHGPSICTRSAQGDGCCIPLPCNFFCSSTRESKEKKISMPGPKPRGCRPSDRGQRSRNYISRFMASAHVPRLGVIMTHIGSSPRSRERERSRAIYQYHLIYEDSFGAVPQPDATHKGYESMDR